MHPLTYLGDFKVFFTIVQKRQVERHFTDPTTLHGQAWVLIDKGANLLDAALEQRRPNVATHARQFGLGRQVVWKSTNTRFKILEDLVRHELL